MKYTQEEIDQYFDHVSFSTPIPAEPSLEYLTRLQKRQLAKVPFESLTLHYSKHHLLSLVPDDLYKKIVVRGMGGYCMENNTFFGVVLRTLGFTLINAGGRISNATAGRPGNGFMGW